MAGMFGLVVRLALAALVNAPIPVHRVTIGHSVRGVALRATVIGDPAAPRHALVVGCVHGNECAGEAIVARLMHMKPPPGVALWLVPTGNPDGHALNTRQNARGVDLNRNFPYQWRTLGAPGGTFWSGPRPLSEPESRSLHRLMVRVHPALTIWYHQQLQVVDDSGGDPGIEGAYARAVRLPFTCLPRYPGSITSWENHTMPGTTAFVVELPGGRLSGAATQRHAAAALAAAAGRTDGARSPCRR
jgi:protein MpaA